MKSLWTVVSVLALANLLMLGGFVGWLASTGRLNRDRADAVRALFVKTVQEEAAVKAEADAAAGEKAKADAAAAKLAQPPVAAAERIRETQDAAELSGQSRHRLESDIRSLQTFLVRENERLQAWEKELQAKQAAFETEQKRVRETSGSDQFKKAMATLAGVKPKEAQSILAELLAQNKHDEVISYLDAMEERTRSKVLAEFNKTDPRVAADLLERLRTRGIASAMPVGPPETPQ
jgi:flagellar motility protein MotE (MotC chaperone)